MKHILLLFLALAAACSLSAQQRIYVNATATGGNNGQNWTDAYQNLHTALEVTKPGDSIWVAAGIYKPAATARDSSFKLKSGVALFGGFSGSEVSFFQRDWQKNSVVLSGDLGLQGDSSDNSYTIMYLDHSDSSTVLDGLVFRDGCADFPGGTVPVNHPWRSGGALYIMGAGDEAYPSIRYCRFERNRARNSGGAVYINGINEGSVAPRFWHCVFEYNIARDGGAVRRDGGSAVERRYDFGWCEFKNNYAKNYGGGLCFYESQQEDALDLFQCTFSDCTAALRGGGIFAVPGKLSGGVFIIDSCMFIRNNSKEGAAIQTTELGNGQVKEINIRNSTFFDNNNKEMGVFIAVFNLFGLADTSLIKLNNCKFISNKGRAFVSEMHPGKTYIENCLFENNLFGNLNITFDNGAFIRNSIFIDNSSGLNAYLNTENVIFENVFARGMGNSTRFASIRAITNLSIINSFIFYNNVFLLYDQSSTPASPFPIQLKNCIVLSNALYSDQETGLFTKKFYFLTLDHVYMPKDLCKFYLKDPAIICGPNNLIGLDPLFVAPDSGDYRLQPCSPLVNAGNNTYVSPTTNTDLAGQPRIQGGTVDIGAYETAAPLLAALPAVQPACSNQPNGGVNLPVAGGCAPFSYQWTTAGGQSGSGTSNLKSGAYTFTVSDQRGSTFTVSLAVPDSSTVALASLTVPVQCGDTLGGTAIARTTGGQPPYLFDWPGSVVMDSVRTDLPPGLYSVTVQDARGCTASAVAEVKKQGSLGSKVEVGEISCFGAADGSLTVLPANGKAPYHWNWADSPALDAPMLSPLGPGQYRVTLTDAFGCDIAWMLPLTQPDPLQVESVVIQPATNSATADGSVSVMVTGGMAPYTAQWSNGSTGLSISGLKPDVYTLTLSDQNDCSFTATYVVDVVSGTSEPGGLPGFSVLPNPTEAEVQILLSEPAEASNLLRVLDASGRLTGQWTVPEGMQQLRLDLGDLTAGVYWVQWNNGKGTTTRRVLKYRRR